MKLFEKWYIRMAAFVMGFLVLCWAMELVLLSVETQNLVSFTEARQEESADVYFVGSSWLRNQAVSTIVSEESGIDAYTLSTQGAMLQAKKAMLQELFKNKHPKYVVVDYDILTYEVWEDEPAVVQAYLWPFLSWDVKAESVITAAQADGYWLDRVFPWRFFRAKTVRNLGGNVAKKVFPGYFRDHYAEMYSPDKVDEEIHYLGSGYFGMEHEMPEDYDLTYASAYYPKDDMPLEERTAKGLLELRDICADNDCQLILLVPPVHRARALSDEGFVKGNAVMSRFCEENDILFWNFQYIRQEVMEPVDAYFYDRDHINLDGSRIFSRAVGKLLKAYENGEDVRGMFYTDAEFSESVDHILNTYYMVQENGDTVTYTAYANAGSLVQPLYQFVLTDSDGREDVLQAYSENRVLTLETAQLSGKQLRLYAMNGAAPEQGVCSFPRVRNNSDQH